MTRDETVEKVARGIAVALGANWDARDFNETQNGETPEEERAHFSHIAESALATLEGLGWGAPESNSSTVGHSKEG